MLGLLLVVLGIGSALVSARRLPPAMRGPPAAAMMGTLVSSSFLSNLEFKFFWALLTYVAISVTLAAQVGGEPRRLRAGDPVRRSVRMPLEPLSPGGRDTEVRSGGGRGEDGN